jgi:hypothetical protein
MCVAGCSSGSKGAGNVDPKTLGLKDIPKMGQSAGGSPEMEMIHLRTSQEKANYLRSLDKDPNFDPKKHTDMLERYSKDNDADLAQAAKDLLAK